MNSLNRLLERWLPHGLYHRSLIIVIAPMVILQTIMVGIILNKYWDDVTKVLGRSLAREIGLITDLYDKSDKSEAAITEINTMARSRLGLDVTIVRDADLPPRINRSFFFIVDRRLARYLERETGRPFWINSTADNSKVEIQVELRKRLIFRILTDSDRTYASGTVPVLMWMLVSSLILLTIAVVFLRKQIKPIVELADAAQSFGLGRDDEDYHPRGAMEVRQAGLAFIDMRERISRHVEQRTAMLAGVSHDLRTILTRFKLELAFLGEGPKVAPLKEDVEEMQQMLEAYIAFVKGDGGEASRLVGLQDIMASLINSMAKKSERVTFEVPNVEIKVKPAAFRRLLANLIGNALRYAHTVSITGQISGHDLRLVIDDDGPGIPPELREDAFRPFVRLDNARNMDETGTGLGLSIARDIAHTHGGEIILDESPKGGLRVIVDLPV